MDQLIPFNYQEKSVRVVMQNGEPWWVAKDVCDVLELSNPTIVVSRLDADEVTKFNLGGLVGESNIVNEAGLYSLILGSRKPEAKVFKRWVTHEVLPTIRKTGKYESPELKKTNEGKTEMLAVRRMRAEAYLLAERRKQGQALQSIIKEFADKLSPEAVASLTAKSAELIAGEPVISLPAVEQHFLSCEQIAKRVGLFSLSGKPHKQAIAALLEHVETDEIEKLTVVEKNGAWQGTTVKYAESVVPKLEEYIEELGKPSILKLNKEYRVAWH